MTFFTWCQFALVCLLGAVSPGPSLALIVYNSINYNRLSGIIASVAHGLGILVYALITVIILEYILKNSETIFFVIQVFGSIFLMFLGFIFLLRKNNNEEYDDKKISSNSFIQGFTIALINPKILVWFAAIYSQFIFINSSILEKTILVLTPTFVDALWYSLVSIMVTGYGLKEFLNKRKSILKKIIGVFLIIISLSIIYSLFAMR